MAWHGWMISAFLNMAAFLLSQVTANLDPEVNMSMPEIVAYHGYPFEEYEVLSEDGFYTWIQRIPFGKTNTNPSNRKPVIIQHGMRGISALWVLNVPAMNLAYILAEDGYDVWLTNSRGNAYSLHHKKYNISQPEFWAHDWHEMGYYDMPAFIDFILDKTGYSQLLYIGHSMGTTIAFVMLSERPEYNEKVKASFMMAPVATLNFVPTSVRGFDGLINVIELAQWMGYFVLNTSYPLVEWMLQNSCSYSLDLLCKLELAMFVDSYTLRLNISRVPVYAHLNLNPSSLSTQTLVHYGQVMEAGKFQKFDYGQSENMNKYNQLRPPEYNLSAISSAIYLYYSDFDELASSPDVADLAYRLINLNKTYRVPDTFFSHLDYVWGLDVKRLVYDPLLEDMKAAWPMAMRDKI